MVTEEMIQERIASLCDAETTTEERQAYESEVRLGAALDEAHEMAERLAQFLSKLQHDYWHTPAEPRLLDLVRDARWLRDNIHGWFASEREE